MPKFTLRIRERLNNIDPLYTRGLEPHYRRGMVAFWLDSVFASISDAFMGSYITLYALALGATNTQIGAMSSVASLMGMIAPIPGAQLAASWGSRRRVVVRVWSVARTLGFFLVLVPFFLRGEAAVLAVIALWALRAGLANLAHPAWVSLSADVVPAERRGGFFSTRNMSMALIAMLFVPLAGQLIDWVGAPGGFQWALALSTLFGLIALFFYARIPEPGAGQVKQAVRPSEFWRALVENRVFGLYALIMMAWNFAIQVGGPFFSVYQVKVLGSSTAMIGLLNMAMSLTRLIGQRFWGPIVDRRGSRWVMAVCALCIPLLPWVWIVARRPWHIVFMSLPGGFVWAGFDLASFNVLLELPHPERRTQAAAAYTTLVSISMIVAPLIGGLIVNQLGYRWTFAASSLGRMTGALLMVWLLKPFALSLGRRLGGRTAAEK